MNCFDIEKITLLQSKSLLMVDANYFWLPYYNGRLKGPREGEGPWARSVDYASELRWLLGRFLRRGRWGL